MATSNPTAPLTAEVSYIDPNTKARKRITVKSGDVLPDGRKVLSVERLGTGGTTAATLTRSPTATTGKAEVGTSPGTKRQATPTPAIPAAAPAKAEEPKEAAAIRGGEGDVMKKTNGKSNGKRSEKKVAPQSKAKTPTQKTPKAKAERKGRDISAAQRNFTPAQADALKKLRKSDADKWTFKALGVKFGVSENYAYRIVKGTAKPGKK